MTNEIADTGGPTRHTVAGSEQHCKGRLSSKQLSCAVSLSPQPLRLNLMNRIWIHQPSNFRTIFIGKCQIKRDVVHSIGMQLLANPFLSVTACPFLFSVSAVENSVYMPSALCFLLQLKLALSQDAPSIAHLLAFGHINLLPSLMLVTYRRATSRCTGYTCSEILGSAD